MLEPLNFNFEDTANEIECILCKKKFNLSKTFLKFAMHILTMHNCVIEEVQNIKNLPKYILYWKERLKTKALEEIIPSVKIGPTVNHYFIFSTLLKEDNVLRHELNLEHALEVQQKERFDTNYKKQCIYCRYENEGTRKDYLDHLSSNHNLQLGHPDNLVFIDELIDIIEKKMESLTCIYCEGKFTDRNVMKEHMRKKLHKRLNPDNREYDKFYIVNYLEVGKSWKQIELETDDFVQSINYVENCDEDYSDWNENNDLIACLFCKYFDSDINLLCLHMDGEHNFDFSYATKNFDFYKKVKLVNYIRRMICNRQCPYCEKCENTTNELDEHLRIMEHYKIPKSDLFDQPEYYFPTYENDSFLYLIDDLSEE